MSGLLSRFKKKHDEGKKSPSHSKAEKDVGSSDEVIVDMPRPQINAGEEPGSSGDSLFSGLRISASSESPTISQTASHQLDADKNPIDQVETGGATGFSFINQSDDAPNIEAGGVVLPEKSEQEIDMAAQAEPSETDFDGVEKDVDVIAELGPLDMAVGGTKDGKGEEKGGSSVGSGGQKRKKKLRAKRPGHQRDALEQAETQSQGEPTVETLVSYDTDQNKEEIEDVFHIQGREMENESNSDLKDIQLVAEACKPPAESNTKEPEPVLSSAAKNATEKDESPMPIADVQSEQLTVQKQDTLISNGLSDCPSHDYVTKEESSDTKESLSVPEPIQSISGHAMDEVTEEGTGNEDDRDKSSEHACDAKDQLSRYDIELNVSEKLAITVQSSEAKLAEIRQQWSDLYQEQRDDMTSQQERHEVKLKKRQQMVDLRLQQATAVSEENYERADELNSQIDSLSMQLDELSIERADHLDKLQLRLNVLSEHEVEVRQELMQRLSEVKEEEMAVLSQFRQDMNAIATKERQHLNVSRDRVQRQQSHIQLDREHYEKGETLLMKEVEEKSSEFTAAKKRLLGLRDGIRAEIGELEARLVLLHSREAEYTSSIASEDEKITAIKQEMALERERLDNQKAQIEDQQLALDIEMEELVESQHTFDMMLEEDKDKEAKFVSEIQSIVCHIEECESRIDQLKLHRQHVESVLMEGRLMVEENVDLNRLVSVEHETSENLQSLTAKLLEQQVHASKLRKQLKNIEESLPGIQEAKKLAASSRNFKEASRLAKEATSLSEQQQTVSNELSELEEQLANNEETLNSVRSKHDSLKQELDSRQKESDVKLLQDAVNRAASLKRHIESLSSEKNGFLCLLFQSEISHCMVVARELSAKHELPVPEATTHNVAAAEEQEKLTEKSYNGSEVTKSEHVLQERTPGVGEEFDLRAADKRGSGAGEPSSEMLHKEKLAVQKRIEELEKQVKNSVEKEDYDTAATLDEEIQKLKSTL